ncbi:MAG TPA: hypothetical protein VFX58_04095 [Chitinophagaceae bacterium]|nr:hypothetical protein [Chitinophagaceae bacterium]
METFKQIGLIICGQPQQPFKLAAISSLKGYNLKKVLLEAGASENTIRLNHPEAEIVNNRQSIIEDHNLDLIVITAAAHDHTELISEILQSGKPVRLVSEI